VYPIDGLPYWRSALLTVYPIMYTTHIATQTMLMLKLYLVDL